MQKASNRTVALASAAVLGTAVLAPVAARAATHYYHDDSVWANALSSLGGVTVPYDFAVFLRAGDGVLHGRSPYVSPASLRAGPDYVYPPLLALAVTPLAEVPQRAVHNTFLPGVFFSLLLIAATVGGLLLLDVRDWRCYPLALVSPISVQPVEYGALGPLLFLLVALAWRFRDRGGIAGSALGGAAVLKLFLAPVLLWLAFTRRVRAVLVGVALALGLALASWAAIGFDGLGNYPRLLRKLTDLEASHSYSAYAILRTIGIPSVVASALVLVAGVGFLLLAWRAAHAESSAFEQDRRSLILTLAAALVLTPILWLHYLVLLLVPIALARPRLSLLWLAPVALAAFDTRNWYGGWPNGEGRALGSVAAVVVIVFAVSLRRLERAAPTSSRTRLRPTSS